MIAIKDMEEMPKSCADCERGSICGYGLGYGRASACPLVEIVTCKDCVHRDEYGCRHGHPNCKDNFYCADGERRK